MWQAAAMTRTGLLAMRYRMAIRPLINFIYALKKQYLTNDQSFTDPSGNFTLPLQVLNQDYQIDVSGASDPIDATARRADMQNAYELLSQNPLIAQDPLHFYALTRKFVETMDWGPEVDKILGTEDELVKKLQAAQAQQQAQAQAQDGQPGQPGQPPQGPQPGPQGQPQPGPGVPQIGAPQQ
jgi:hypothetical protein